MSTRLSIAQYLGGGGRIVGEAVADPGAGNEISVGLPANTERRLLSATFLFTASAVAGNRIVRIIQRAGALPVFNVDAGMVITANQVVQFTVGTLGYLHASLGVQVIGTSSTRFRSVSFDRMLITQTTGLDAGDAFTGLEIMVEEWQVP